MQLGCSLAWGCIVAVAVALFLARQLSDTPQVLDPFDGNLDLVK